MNYLHFVANMFLSKICVLTYRGSFEKSNGRFQRRKATKNAQNKTNPYTEMDFVEQTFRMFLKDGPYIVVYLRFDAESFG